MKTLRILLCKNKESMNTREIELTKRKWHGLEVIRNEEDNETKENYNY